MKKMCSPYSNKYAETFSCYTHKNILLLKYHWNIRHPDNKITTNDYHEIWEELNYYMKLYLCENEKCWLRKLVHDINIQSNIFDESFKPQIPNHWKTKPTSWLSDLDISRVMKQYELSNKDFVFLGPTPIDYDAYNNETGTWVWPELKNFNLERYINKDPSCKMIGIVFNLDNHKGRGTHWVSLFVNIPENKIYYFDSNGHSIPKNIRNLSNTIKEQGIKHNMKFSLSMNYPNEHQKKNSECGVYVIYFLVNMMQKNNWLLFKHGKISDDDIHKHRHVYFSN